MSGNRAPPGKDPVDQPEDEDEQPQPTPTPLWKRPGVLILGGGTLAALIFIFTHGGSPPPPQADRKDSAIAVTQPYEGPPVVKAAAPVTVLQPPPPPPPPAPPPPSPPILSLSTAAGAPKKETAPIHPLEISYPVKIEPPKQLSATTERAEAEPDKTHLKFATSELPGLKASPAIDLTYMLMPGLLPCVLDVAIDSSLPGPLLCHLPGPVYSPKGVVLMEAGTQVIGKYESMKQNGVERLEAISVYAHTPSGILVPLNNQPLADALGRTGMAGNVDKRWIERFGGAVLLDLSQSALQIAQASVAKGGSTYLSFNGSDQLANQILQSTINLPPILTKNPGSAIAIWLTEPISFRDSYRVVAQ